MANTWLITGASSGIGACLALHCLKQGHRVIATARNVAKAEKANPKITSQGGKWLELDVTKTEAEQLVKTTVAEENVDIVVNNAGIALLGTAEDMSDEELHAQMETNLFGPARVIRGAVPHLRTLKSSVIVNMSSAAGVMGQASFAAYSSSKFALAGLSEALSKELAPFNVRILLAELGAFRTPFATTSQMPAKTSTSEGGNGRVSKPCMIDIGTPADLNMERISRLSEVAKGDPEKAAKLVFDVATNSGQAADAPQFLRLPMGEDGLGVCQRKAQELTDNYNAMASLAVTTALDNP